MHTWNNYIQRPCLLMTTFEGEFMPHARVWCMSDHCCTVRQECLGLGL